MPVIINDFEVISEPPAPSGNPNGGTHEPQSSAPALTAEDVERLMAYLAERCARLIAD